VKPEATSSPVETETTPKKMTKVALEKRARAMVEEWWSLTSESEVEATIQEMATPSYTPEVIQFFLEAAMEKKLDKIRKTASLFSDLYQKKFFASEHIAKA